MKRLEDIHLFVVEVDGAEHCAAYVDPRTGRLEPMIASTPEKLEALKSIAEQMVSINPSKPLRLIRLHGREDIAIVEPVPADEQT